MSDKNINRFIFLLSIVGIGISSYLSFTYITHSPIACFDTGCEIVRKSRYAYPLGIPMPIIGFLGNLTIFFLSFLYTLKNTPKRAIAKLLFFISFIGFSVVVYLTAAEIFDIKAYCIWCLGSAFAMTLTFIFSVYLYVKNRKS